MNHTILYLDDDPDLITLARIILLRHGYKVIGATSVKLAIEHLESAEPIAVILVDLMMPGENGWDFLAYLDEQKRWAKIPRIALTAKELISVEEDKQATLKNLSAYLVKPYSPTHLVSTIKRLTDPYPCPSEPGNTCSAE